MAPESLILRCFIVFSELTMKWVLTTPAGNACHLTKVAVVQKLIQSNSLDSFPFCCAEKNQQTCFQMTGSHHNSQIVSSWHYTEQNCELRQETAYLLHKLHSSKWLQRESLSFHLFEYRRHTRCRTELKKINSATPNQASKWLTFSWK